jgi:translation initiation factor 4G
VQEREALLRQTSMRDPGRGRRDTGRSDYGPPQVGADGWTTPVTRPPQTKAGDLSKFGKIERNSGSGLQFGPTSVFSKRGDKRESASVTRVSSSSNMFAMLNSSEATPDAVSVGSRTAASTRPPSRKASIDMSSGTASPIDGPQRRRLILQPRTVPFGGDGSVREGPPSTAATSDYGEEETTSNIGVASPSMTLERAKQKIKEDIKEFFMLKDLNEGEGYFESLPPDFRNELIETLFHKAIDAKESETQLVIELFSRAASKGLATESQFEKGFECDMETLEDISVDVPQVYTTVAKLMHAAKLSESLVERCVHHPVVSCPRCGLIAFLDWPTRSQLRATWQSSPRISCSKVMQVLHRRRRVGIFLYRPIALLSVCDKPDFIQYVYSWSRLWTLFLGRSPSSNCIFKLVLYSTSRNPSLHGLLGSNNSLF